MKSDWLQALKAKDFRALEYFMENGMFPEAPKAKWEKNILSAPYSARLISWALTKRRFDLANMLFSYGVPLPAMSYCIRENHSSERDFCRKLVSYPTDLFIALKQKPALADSVLSVLKKYADKIQTRMSKRLGFFQQHEINYQVVSKNVAELRQAQSFLREEFTSMCNKQGLTAYDYMSLPPTNLQVRHDEIAWQIKDMETKIENAYTTNKSDQDKDTEKLIRIDELHGFVQTISLS